MYFSSETTDLSPLDQNYRATSRGTSVQCQIKTFIPEVDFQHNQEFVTLVEVLKKE